MSPSVDSFIDKGADVKTGRGKEFRNVLVRVPGDILADLDAYLVRNKPWLPRNQWIIEAVHDKLKSDA